MRFKLADDLKLRPREWSILRYLLSQFPNGHLFEAFYKRISLCLLNEKFVNWWTWRTLYPPLILINVTHSIWTLNKCIWITKMVFPASSGFLIKNPYLDSFKSFAYKYILSISSCSFIDLSNTFVFPDPELRIIKIPYGWSGINSHF